MIKKEYIGQAMTVRALNGTLHKIVVTEDPKHYKFYKLLGLDIFEEKKKINDSEKINK